MEALDKTAKRDLCIDSMKCARQGANLLGSIGGLISLVACATGNIDGIGSAIFLFLISYLSGGVIGSLIALIIWIATGSLEFVNWAIALIIGTGLSFLSVAISWLSITFIPVLGALLAVLLLLHKYISRKLPQWIDRSLDMAMPTFFGIIILSFLTAKFASITGIRLIIPESWL